jgi:hypothetical protein
MIADLPTASANSSRQFEAIFYRAPRTPKFACSRDARRTTSADSSLDLSGINQSSFPEALS